MTETELYHWGILGQKWGVRRYQNLDGTRTAAGKARYYKAKADYKSGNGSSKEMRSAKKALKRNVLEDRGEELYNKGVGIAEIDHEREKKSKIAGTVGGVAGITAGTALFIANAPFAAIGVGTIAIGSAAADMVIRSSARKNKKAVVAFDKMQNESIERVKKILSEQGLGGMTTK